MGNVTTMMVFISTINILFFITNFAIMDINPSQNTSLYDNSGTVFADIPNYATKENFTSALPLTTTVVSATGLSYVDPFSTFRDWLQGTIGYKIVASFFNTPYLIAKSVGFPKQIADAISIWWWGITLIIVILFLRGND